MNDLSPPPTNQTSPAQDSASPPNATGSVITLRQARERAGLQLAELAAMLKIPVRRLEALEAGRFHELPNMTFARALALSVCRALKVDPQPILANFPASAEVRLSDIDRTLNTPMPKRASALTSAVQSAEKSALSWPMAFAVFMGVVAIVLWFFLPGREAPPTVALQSPVAVSAPVPAPDATSDESSEGVQAEVIVATPPVLPADATNGLSMTARETSWVQVTGASGRVLLQRSLQPGETVILSADFPLSVVVGRADEVTVNLRGAPFNTAPHTRNNVARFEVR